MIFRLRQELKKSQSSFVQSSNFLRDSVTISVDAVVYYQVSNPLSAICNNDDYNRSTRLLAQTTLRLENVKAVDLHNNKKFY